MASEAQAILASWRSLDLPSLQAELDDTASELASRQDASDESRRTLVDLSREFKRSASQEAKKASGNLLRRFQSEVDALASRSRQAEAAFLSLYGRLVDLQDPVGLLEHSASREAKVASLEAENARLALRNREVEMELKEARNQDVTLRGLREELRSCREAAEAKATSGVREARKQLEVDFARAEADLKEELKDCRRRLGEAETREAGLRSALEVANSDLFDLRSRAEESLEARRGEADLLTSDLERASQRAVMAEEEAERLRERLAEAKTSGQEVSGASLEAELASRDQEVSQLVKEVKNLQDSLEAEREASERQRTHLEAKATEDEASITRLEAELALREDYEEVKRELEVLKTMEFGASVEVEAPLEVRLLARSKALQGENAALRQVEADLSSRLSGLEQELEASRSQASRQEALIGSLEADLSSLGERRRPSELPAEVVGGLEKDSILPILSAQRERLQLRILHLEAESDGLRRENLSLRQQESPEADLLLHPSFRRPQEHQVWRPTSQRRRSGGPLERLAISLGRLVQASRPARAAVMAYVALVHLLVFLVLYRLAHVHACRLDVASECTRKFAEHMHHVHGEQ